MSKVAVNDRSARLSKQMDKKKLKIELIKNHKFLRTVLFKNIIICNTIRLSSFNLRDIREFIKCYRFNSPKTNCSSR